MTETRGRLARVEPYVVALLIAVYVIVYGLLSILRHETYHSLGADLGLFDQIFWNTTQGRFFESTMSLGQPNPHSYLSDHFSPIYLVLLPFYAMVPRPETLLLLQTVFLALGVWPLYLLARLKLAPGFPRLAFVLAYFLFLPVAFINLFDFHELALCVLPLGFAIYFLERGRPVLFLASLFSTFLIKEELPLIGLAFGAYILVEKRNVWLGVGVLAASAASFFAIIRLIIPAFGGGAGYVYFTARYGQLGTSPQQIMATIVTHPVVLAKTVLQGQKLKFLAGIFGPVLGLTALSGWAAILVLPTLAYLLLSDYPPQFAFTSHYAAPLIALVIGTSILGVSRLKAPWLGRAAAAVLASSLAFAYLFGDLPFSRHFDPRLFAPETRYAAFIGELNRIPPGASVAAENDLTPHLSHRRLIYDMEFEGAQHAEYLALDDATFGGNATRLQRQLEVFAAQGYREIASGDGLALLQRQ